MCEVLSTDVRRCTVVKIQASDRCPESPPPLPKARDISLKVDSLANRWTPTAESQPQFESSLLDGLSPNASPTSTFTKPKRKNSLRDENEGDKGLQSLSYVGSDNIFGEKFKRSETFNKKFSGFKDNGTVVDSFGESRHSRGIFVSQIHLIFHISITICLIGYKGL